MTENKKARPQGRAGLGAGVSNAPLGGHPYTCDLAAAREAVVEMHMVMNPGAHDECNASRAGCPSQISVEFGAFVAQRRRAKDCISGGL